MPLSDFFVGFVPAVQIHFVIYSPENQRQTLSLYPRYRIVYEHRQPRHNKTADSRKRMRTGGVQGNHRTVGARHGNALCFP